MKSLKKQTTRGLKKYCFYMQITFAVLFMAAAADVFPVHAAQAEQESLTEKYANGLLPLEEIIISGEEAEEIPVYEPEEETIWSRLFSGLFSLGNHAEEEAYWHQYSNYYLYNLMSEEEQAYYDMLDEACMNFLLSDDEAIYNKANDIYYLPSVVSEDLTRDEMKAVYSIFRYNNGQYYFINSRIITVQKDGQTGIAPGVYKAFYQGAERSDATEQVREQLDQFSEQIEEEAPEQQTKLIHDWIIDKVYYNSAINNAGFDDETELSQTIYSVLCMDKTVCAGYAQTFAALCNRAGIDAISVTSATHEWNKVRLYDSWYNVDCTWDDQGSAVYTYYLRSDEVYDKGAQPSSHAEETLWDGYLPLCTLDAAPESSRVPGVPAKITQQTSAPVLQALWQEQERGYLVTATCANEDGYIYYTLNGDNPSPARTKSSVYRQPVLVGPEVTIQAVAVSNARLDSEIGRLQLPAVTPDEGETESGKGSEAAESEKVSTETSESQRNPTVAETPESQRDPTVTETPESQRNPTVTETPESQGNPTVTPESGKVSTETAGSSQTEKPLKKGDTFTVGGNTYQVTKTGGSATVKFLKTEENTTALVIPATVKYRSIKYRVTAMAAKACSGHAKIRTAVIGKNISVISKYAFRNCSNLKKVTLRGGVTVIKKYAFKNSRKLSRIVINTNKLSKVGAGAFKGIPSSAKISVPAKKLKKYQKVLKGKGQGVKVKIVAL